jgi:hypothetical protein
MKLKIEIKNRFTGKILFEFETENNTTLKTLKQAVAQKKDLTGADLTGAYLRGADLTGADLTGADLTGAYLRGAYLRGAYLTGADLTGADLRGADLTGAYLRGADLTGADLRGAYLTGAYLRGAYLRGAYLTGADLTGADLTGADLTGADLTGADGKQIKISNTAVFTGLYKYLAMPIIAEDDKQYIRLGCYTRLLEDWEKDFWNNICEFPNDNSMKSNLRLLAYETCKKWLELNTPKPH